MAHRVWDVAVVGAGPAGAAAALRVLQLRPEAQVLLIDRAEFPRDKACGDGIAPHALDVLASLGVEGAVDGFTPVDTLTLCSPVGESVSRPMRRSAWVVPRRVFDARLVRAAVSRGAAFEQRLVRRVSAGRSYAVLDGDIAARVVIGADGANSRMRRAVGVPANGSRHTALAIRGYVANSAYGSEQLIRLSGHRWPAYAWAFPIGDGTANVGYGEVLLDRRMDRAHLVERLHALLPDLGQVSDLRAHPLPLSSQPAGQLAGELAGQITRQLRGQLARQLTGQSAGQSAGQFAQLLSRHTPQPAPQPVQQPDGRVLLAGDALSLINPFTGEGIYYAVLSGMLAGEVASMAVSDPDLDGRTAKGSVADPGQRYRSSLGTAFGRHLRSTRATARLARSPLLVDSAVRAARSDQRVFDDLVELGLGRGVLTLRTLASTVASTMDSTMASTARQLPGRQTIRSPPER